MSRIALSTWSNVHAIMILLACFLALYFSQILIIVVFAIISLGFLLWSFKSIALSWANTITVSRFLLICLSVHLFERITTDQLFVFLSIVLVMDLLDGYVARRTNTSSRLGFILDLEVDAFFVLLMSFYFYQFRDVHLIVLLPGLLRYLYKLLTMIIARRDYEESKKWYAAMVAGTYFVILLISVILPDDWISYLLLIGGTAICFSFGVSFVEYLFYAKKDRSSELLIR